MKALGRTASGTTSSPIAEFCAITDGLPPGCTEYARSPYIDSSFLVSGPFCCLKIACSRVE